MPRGPRVLRSALLALWLVSGAALAQQPGATPTDEVALRASQPAVWVEPAPATATAVPIESLFPKLTGRVVDTAQMLTPETVQYLSEMLARHERSTGDQVVVVTVANLGGYSIEDFGLRLGRYWGVGQKDKNNGVLLLVARDDRKVRIEVGYGLEDPLTDAVAGVIINGAITPYFKDGLYSQGVIAGVTSVVSLLQGEGLAGIAFPPDQQTLWTVSLVTKLFYLGLFLVIILLSWYFTVRTKKPAVRKQANNDPRADSEPRQPSYSSQDSSSSSSWSSYSDSGSSSSSSDADSYRGGGGSFGGGGASGSW